MTNGETYGDTMRRLRLELGMTQPEVARLAKVSQETISVWERNQRYGVSPEAAELPRRVIRLLNARLRRRRKAEQQL